MWAALKDTGFSKEGEPVLDLTRITVPETEQALEYPAILKVIVEVIFDAFLQSYIFGISAQRMGSIRSASSRHSGLLVEYRRHGPPIFGTTFVEYPGFRWRRSEQLIV